MKPFDTIILGAGIMGLETARLLAKAGLRVALVDTRKPAREASWAAAGILVSRGSTRSLSKNRQLYCQSIANWPDWVKAVEQEAHMPIDLFKGGDICLMYNQATASRFAGRLRSEQASPCIELDTLPSWISEQDHKKPLQIYHFPDEKYVNNRMVLDALLHIVEESDKIDCFYQTEQARWIKQGDTHQVWLNEGHCIEANHISICSGAWSGQIFQAYGYDLSLKAVRGQVYQINRWYEQSEMVHIDDQYYLVPRGDHLLVGGTSETDVWEQGTNEKGRLELETVFQQCIPDFHIPKDSICWSGIRPKIADAKPIVGYLEGDKSISMNFGHYRTGISMMPLCCSEYVQGLLHERMPESLGDFNPHRPQGLHQVEKCASSIG